MSMEYEEQLAGSLVDSFPKDFGYGVENMDMMQENMENSPSADNKPRILLMGLRRSGKSSIQKVVFHKMSPNETLFLESTNKIYKDDISGSSFVNFHIWDFPGQVDFFDPTFDYEMIFRGTGALIFVIDAQDDYVEALGRLHLTVSRAFRVNPEINFEVFIHKVDGLSDDHKIETQRDIHQRANDDLADASLEKLHLSFYLTSIYDHSIFEAFSKVVQKLIPQLPTLENLLNIFISNSGIEKAFLFDVVSKIYIATDSSPVDMQSYELCCDMIDVVIDVSCIYGLKDDGNGNAYDKESLAIIKLNNTTVLYLKEVTKFLALVCILREESFERKGLIDYNFHCFRKAIHEVFEVSSSTQRTGVAVQSSPPSSSGNGLSRLKSAALNDRLNRLCTGTDQLDTSIPRTREHLNPPAVLSGSERSGASCQKRLTVTDVRSLCTGGNTSRKSETNGTTPSDVEAQLSPPYHSKDYHAWRDCKKMDAVDQGEGRNPTCTTLEFDQRAPNRILCLQEVFEVNYSFKVVSRVALLTLTADEVFNGCKRLEYGGCSWHEECFVCCGCEKPIGGQSFIPDKDEFYCVPCYEGRFSPRCAHCKQILVQGGVTYRDEPWHKECFLCSGCKVQLAGQPFTTQGEDPFCVKCFSNLYAQKCVACDKPITGFGEGKYVSFEDRQWHQSCFKCSECSVSLVGAGFFPDGTKILCKSCNAK
ncbi:four and a half LIM domains protein [Pimephales promelas]|nr:four and a half LIM domains protein [Pimephales promelas]